MVFFLKRAHQFSFCLTKQESALFCMTDIEKMAFNSPYTLYLTLPPPLQCSVGQEAGRGHHNSLLLHVFSKIGMHVPSQVECSMSEDYKLIKAGSAPLKGQPKGVLASPSQYTYFCSPLFSQVLILERRTKSCNLTLAITTLSPQIQLEQNARHFSHYPLSWYKALHAEESGN